jgi:glutathione S-transferase
MLYGDANSGNCHKVRFVADHLGLRYAWVPVDIMRGESRTPAYLAKFPQGQVPAIELEDGRRLAQSNAIVRYLARGSSLLPDDAWAQAKIDEWLFWEQYSHEPYIATTRYHVVYLNRTLDQREAWRVERGETALDLLEESTKRTPFLTGEDLTIADIALVAYTRLAHEGGFDMRNRRNVCAWIARCEDVLGLEPAPAHAQGGG